MRRMFFAGLFLICASTLMYEIVLTRLLSAVSWYYLAFVSVSTAMSGMTAGALLVQLRPRLFSADQVPLRLYQSSLAMAASLPLTLLTMLAIPFGVSHSLETLYVFLLLSAVMATPFFFSGIAVCLSLTKSPFPVGQVYSVDLIGAGIGCFGALALLRLVDAPSAMFVISALVFLATAGYASYAGNAIYRKRAVTFSVVVLALGVLNASSYFGIQPIWLQEAIDTRSNIQVEVWNPISKVRAFKPTVGTPSMWGASPHMPPIQKEQIGLLIDNDAGTWITHYHGNFQEFDFLRYDVSSFAAELRQGGDAAIIGVGGGRDVLNVERNGFHRVVGIEVNPSIADLASRRLDWFSGFSKFGNFELHVDEGRSYLTRTGEKFDLIQASMVDTWAATAAGAMALTENGLYTVEGWRIFYQHLKPGGLISFSRWHFEPHTYQTYRLFALAWAALEAEGVTNPGDNIALLASGRIATLVASNRPLAAEDLRRIHSIAREMDFEVLYCPGEPTTVPELRTIAATHTLADLTNLRNAGTFDISPPFDSSPYFFFSVRLPNLWRAYREAGAGIIRPLVLMVCFFWAAVVLMLFTIFLPLKRGASLQGRKGPIAGCIVYFAAIGLAFMLIEMGMMQQLSIFLGHPIYSLAVVLAGLILSTGVGSLISEKFPFVSGFSSRIPVLGSALMIVLYSLAVVPLIHAFTADPLWIRMAISVALVAPCGLIMGFAFPVGLRWMTQLGYASNLPWMWALNGAAAVVATFGAMVLSTEVSISGCVLAGALCYLAGGVALPWTKVAERRQVAVGAA